jgi:hypothetical protein
MKPIRMFGLTTIAAVAMMAFAGTGTASASGLDACAGVEEGEKGICALGLKLYTGPRVYHILAFAFASTLTTIECKTAEASGEVTDSGVIAKNAYGKIDKMSIKECSSSCGAATVTPTNLPWKFEATSTKTEVIKGVGGEFTTCGQTCKYEAAETTAEFAGGTKATETLNKVSLKKVSGGAFCPSTATWFSIADLLPEHFTYAVLI